MSKADFDAYYNLICRQYHELQQAVNDLTVDVESGMVEPERLENLKLTVAPVENSYRTLCYMKYILDKPVRGKKQKRYSSMNKKLLDRAGNNTREHVEAENNQIIQGLKI